MESTTAVEQKVVLDDFLERAADVIAAQSKPGPALIRAKLTLSRKVQEVTKAAHEHVARQLRRA